MGWVSGRLSNKVDAGLFSDRQLRHCQKAAQPSFTYIDTGKFDQLASHSVLGRAGDQRVILAELSTRRVVLYAGSNLELEAFVHGAMCMAYNGTLSALNYMTGRDANRGDCVSLPVALYSHGRKRPSSIIRF